MSSKTRTFSTGTRLLVSLQAAFKLICSVFVV